MNRTLRQTSSHDAWLCSYQDLSRPDAKDAVRQQFREVANHLEALVQFLRLVMMVEAAQRPISAGEHLREGKLLERISTAPSLEAKLRSLCEKTCSAPSAATARANCEWYWRTLPKPAT